MKQVLIVVGCARSGKDTVAGYLARKHGFKKIVFSDFVGKELKRRGIKPTKQNMSKYGQQLRDELGQDYLVKQVLAEAEKHEKVAICGVKPMWEYNPIKERFPQAKMILVKADPEKRFLRRADESVKEFEKFLERDRHDEREYTMKEAFSKKDFEIENNGTLEELYFKIEGILEEQ